jgi:hydrogenase maturation protease
MGIAARILCLGNDLLADDALGRAAAERLAGVTGPELEVVYAPGGGFALLDHLSGAPAHLVLIDAIHTGQAPPGTIHELDAADLVAPAGPSPHYVGVLEMLQLARALDLGAPDRVTILAVETADEVTVGGMMHPLVASAIPQVCSRALAIAGAAGHRTVEHV